MAIFVVAFDLNIKHDEKYNTSSTSFRSKFFKQIARRTIVEHLIRRFYINVIFGKFYFELCYSTVDYNDTGTYLGYFIFKCLFHFIRLKNILTYSPHVTFRIEKAGNSES